MSRQGLRIGVTGHRAFETPELVAWNVREAVLSLTRGSGAVIVVSALAEGADRLVVHAVAALGNLHLEVVLPLQPDLYRRDFTTADSAAEFDRLLAGAETIDVIGSGRRRDVAYELAGRAVVDRCDVLLALWDGKPARGRGGTADIVDYALRQGRKVVWVPIRAGETLRVLTRSKPNARADQPAAGGAPPRCRAGW